jgi:DNA modification methylase
MAFEIKHGDCLEVMRGMADNSVDAIVTDPPYGLVGASRGGSSQPGDLATPYGRSGPSKKRGGFMGKEWDASIPGAEYWSEALRIAKPGAYILAFGGTRTFHRLAVAIEDAGWEIRDTLMWVYGSGFPKSRNVCLDMDKMDGHGNRGHRIAVANRHHPDGTLEPNGEHLPAYEPKTDAAKQWAGWGTALKPAWEPIIMARKPLVGTVAANVLEHGTGALNIDGCRVETDDNLNGGAYSNGSKDLGEATSYATGVNAGVFVQPAGRWPANLIHDGSEEVVALFPDVKAGVAVRSNSGGNTFGGDKPKPPMDDMSYGDKGSAARFFYCAKASKADRGESNGHPTVKPTELMRYLVRLVTQPGGTVLDPFTGSGSTGKAAILEGFSFIGIEKEEASVDISTRRMKEAQIEMGLFA